MEEPRRMRCVVRMDTWFASIPDRCVNIFPIDCPFVSSGWFYLRIHSFVILHYCYDHGHVIFWHCVASHGLLHVLTIYDSMIGEVSNLSPSSLRAPEGCSGKPITRNLHGTFY